MENKRSAPHTGLSILVKIDVFWVAVDSYGLILGQNGAKYTQEAFGPPPDPKKH